MTSGYHDNILIDSFSIRLLGQFEAQAFPPAILPHENYTLTVDAVSTTLRNDAGERVNRIDIDRYGQSDDTGASPPRLEVINGVVTALTIYSENGQRISGTHYW